MRVEGHRDAVLSAPARFNAVDPQRSLHQGSTYIEISLLPLVTPEETPGG
jgi:hypothetical protein